MNNQVKHIIIPLNQEKGEIKKQLTVSDAGGKVMRLKIKTDEYKVFVDFNYDNLKKAWDIFKKQEKIT